MDKTDRIARLLGLVLPLSSLSVFADHPSAAFGTNQAGPLITISAATLPAGKWSTGFRTERVTFSPLSATVLEQAALDDEEIHSVDSLTTHYASLAYGINDQLTIGVTIPYISRTGIREGELDEGNPEVHAHQKAAGLGDATLLAQYRLKQPSDSNTQIGILLGMQLPTGDDNIEEAGVPVGGEFQPGSGTWQPMIGISASRTIGNSSLDTNLLYLHTREGSQYTRIGRLLNYNVAWSRRFSSETSGKNHDHSDHLHVRWDAVIELNGALRAKNEVRNLKEAHSGGNLIYFSPGIRLVVADRWNLHVSIGIPVLDDPNGTQADVDYRTNIGFGMSF